MTKLFLNKPFSAQGTHSRWNRKAAARGVAAEATLPGGQGLAAQARPKPPTECAPSPVGEDSSFLTHK